MKMYAFGALAPTLKEQGYPLTDKQHALVDQMCDGLNTMHIQGIVTDKEYDRITDRMWKQIEGWRKKNEAKP